MIIDPTLFPPTPSPEALAAELRYQDEADLEILEAEDEGLYAYLRAVGCDPAEETRATRRRLAEDRYLERAHAILEAFDEACNGPKLPN
jgi:hypothetical protein